MNENSQGSNQVLSVTKASSSRRCHLMLVFITPSAAACFCDRQHLLGALSLCLMVVWGCHVSVQLQLCWAKQLRECHLLHASAPITLQEVCQQLTLQLLAPDSYIANRSSRLAGVAHSAVLHRLLPVLLLTTLLLHLSFPAFSW